MKCPCPFSFAVKRFASSILGLTWLRCPKCCPNCNTCDDCKSISVKQCMEYFSDLVFHFNSFGTQSSPLAIFHLHPHVLLLLLYVKHHQLFVPLTDSSTAPKQAFSFMVGNATNTVNSTTSSSTIPTPSLFGTSSISSSTQAPAPSAAPSTFMFGQTAATSNDAPPAKAFVFGQSQDSQPSALSAAPLNSTPTPVPAQPFIFGAPASAAAAPPAAAAPSFGFGAAAPTAASTTGPYLLMLVLSVNGHAHVCFGLAAQQ